jgi:hypothetical protein
VILVQRWPLRQRGRRSLVTKAALGGRAIQRAKNHPDKVAELDEQFKQLADKDTKKLYAAHAVRPHDFISRATESLFMPVIAAADV